MKPISPLLFAGSFILISACFDNLSRNRDQIEEIELEKLVEAGRSMTSFEIENHVDSGHSLTVMVKGIADKTKPYRDTLRFSITSDGLIIK